MAATMSPTATRCIPPSYNSCMRSRTLGAVALLVATLGLAVAGQAQAGGLAPVIPSTTAPDLYVKVNVTITNTRFILSLHSGPRGADARFAIHNESDKTNIFAIGNEKYDTGVQTGFSTAVKPGQTKILILFLDIQGKLPYYSGIKADHNNPGMKGIFNIGPCSHYEQITGVGEC
jgi:hypothetical protein